MGLGWEEETEDAYKVLRNPGETWPPRSLHSECAWASVVRLMECFPGRPPRLDTTCVRPHPDLSFSGYSKRLVSYLRNPLLEPLTLHLTPEDAAVSSAF